MAILFAQIKITLVFLLSFISEILTNSCDFDVKVKQDLLNEGFHSGILQWYGHVEQMPDYILIKQMCNANMERSFFLEAFSHHWLCQPHRRQYIDYTRNITYEIVFDTTENSNGMSLKNCIVALEQVLPAGVYVNPDELSDLRRIGKINALPRNRVNIELPTEHSEPNTVYILGKLIHNEVNIWIPVHARYHQAVAGGGMARNEVGAPSIYLRCPDQRLDMCGGPVPKTLSFLCNGVKEKCSWKDIPYSMLTDTLIWQVPVGNLDHYYLVGIGTGLVVVVGSLYLLNAVHEYNIAAKRKRF